MSKRVQLPTYLTEIVQGNRADYAHDKVNDHKAGGPEQWAYDFAVQPGAKVSAVDSGTVVSAVSTLKGSFLGYGNEITIQSTDAQGHIYYTTYAHLGTVSVAAGQTIKAGQQIATSGSSGAGGAAHLHIQFGSTLTWTNLDTTHKSNAAWIADGSKDGSAPAYFDGLIMHYDSALNATDIIYTGTEGADQFYANGLGDTAYGLAGNDTLHGGAGKDYLDGGDGSDALYGGANNDTLYGGGSNDVLIGGGGIDFLNGGGGNDSFVWESLADFGTGSGYDYVSDFMRGDKLDLSALDANTGKSGNQAFSYIGAASFTHHAGELHVQQIAGDWFVSGDVNGDGKADFVFEVHSVTGSLASSDFFL